MHRIKLAVEVCIGVGIGLGTAVGDGARKKGEILNNGGD